MQRPLGFAAYANERGFYVAYPNAYQAPDQRENAHWKDGQGTEALARQGVDGVQFLREPCEEAGIPGHRCRGNYQLLARAAAT